MESGPPLPPRGPDSPRPVGAFGFRAVWRGGAERPSPAQVTTTDQLRRNINGHTGDLSGSGL